MGACQARAESHVLLRCHSAQVNRPWKHTRARGLSLSGVLSVEGGAISGVACGPAACGMESPQGLEP